MSLIEAYKFLNFLCVIGIAIAAYLLWYNRRLVKNIDEILLFSVCIICHLLLTGYLNIRYTIFFWILIGGACLIPFASWILTRALMGVEKLKHNSLLLLTLAILVFNYILAIWDRYSDPKYPDILLNILSLGFMLHSFILVFQSNTFKKDLLENKERKIFVIGVTGIIVVSLMSELALKQNQLIYLFYLQRIVIISLTGYFLVTTFTLKEGIVRKKSSESAPSDPLLADKIKDAVIFDKLFLKEGLTIAQLSEIIQEKEYKVRHAIIHDLEFKNFTDFINSFRIKEASQMLLKPENEGLSILEVAFHVGFSSIGPFNRAFKTITGLTPSQYRNCESEVEPNLAMV